MSQVTSTSLHDPSMPAVARLVDTAGRDGPVTPREVAGQLQAGRFFWLDLEDPGDADLAGFSQSLRLPADTVDNIIHVSARSSFAPAAGSVQAVLPAAVDTSRRRGWRRTT
jgi:Mg2+ and Co2+ transporter CorA